MTIQSRWKVDVPRCSLQKWVFGSPSEPLPDTRVFIDPEQPDTHFLTLGDYRLAAKRLALGFQSNGLEPGDRVLLFSGNNLYFPSVFMGILMAGGIFTGANPTFVTRELAYQLRDSGASVLLAAESGLETALQAAAEVGLPRGKVFLFDAEAARSEVTQARRPGFGPSSECGGVRHWTELLAADPEHARAWQWVEPACPEQTTCCLNYSSGTTGVPKGVEISHSSYVANGVGVVHLSSLRAKAAESQAPPRGLCFLPMYHAYAQTYFVVNLPRQRTPVYIMRVFDFARMLAHVQRFRITFLTCVPPVVVALAKHPIVASFDLSSVQRVGCGAAPLGREVVDELTTRLWPAGRVCLSQGWGMTEATCTCVSWDPTAVVRDADGVGELMPNCAARIVDVDSGAEITRPGVPGELWITGPTLMRGYWRRPRETAEAMPADPAGTRWLRTGDVGYVEGGYGPGAIFHIADRLKELIKVKGNQVAPAELEALLLERPDIVDAAVVGVQGDGEERPRAYVVRECESTATERDVAEWMAGKVAAYKQLTGGVVFVDEIPKSPSGKILRRVLRERAQKEAGDRRPRLA